MYSYGKPMNVALLVLINFLGKHMCFHGLYSAILSVNLFTLTSWNIAIVSTQDIVTKNSHTGVSNGYKIPLSGVIC